MGNLSTDVRYTLRLWGRNPGFTAVAVLTLALGIGANTTMFSVVNATIFSRVPFPDPDRLQTLWRGKPDDPRSINITSLPNYRDWVARNDVFESLALLDSAGRGYNLTGRGEPEQVSGVRVTASFFRVLGVPPMLGRTFRDEEETAGRDRVVVLSHGLWTRRYAADPSIVGRTIPIDGTAYTVVGVMPPTFRFQFWSGERQLWVPAGWTEGDLDRGSNSFICLGRLRDGVSLETARARMDTIGKSLAREYPSNTGETIRVIPVAEYGAEPLRDGMYALFGVVGFVLLIACVNVANLMLARAAARQGELAIRSAIGAGRGRLARQLLTESVLLSLAGAAAGLVLAAWTTTALMAVLPGVRTLPMRPLDPLGLDPRVLAFTLAVAVLSGVLAGLAPMLTIGRGSLVSPLREAGRSSAGGSRNRLRYALVASEVALTVIVLAGAGLMIASLAHLLHVEPGLDTHHVLTMEMSQPQKNLYYGPPDHVNFCRDLAQQAGAVPGVLSVSAIGHLPLSGAGAGRAVAVEGRPDAGPNKRPGAGYTVACPGILRTLGIRLVAGREFTDLDAVGAPDVVLINESMARALWPGETAIGKRFKIGGTADDIPWQTVVGVFGDFRHYGLDSAAERMFMRPFPQAGWPFLSIVAKTAADPAAFAAPVKKALAAIEPGQPVIGIQTMDEVRNESLASRRNPTLLLTAFAILALTLAAVGIAGVVGYTVVQRSPEIGVRMALGAQPADVLRLIVLQSLTWVAAGLGIGIAAAIGASRLLASLLFEVQPTDPIVLTLVSIALAVVALAASVIPARRAVRIDPLQALRCE